MATPEQCLEHVDYLSDLLLNVQATPVVTQIQCGLAHLHGLLLLMRVNHDIAVQAAKAQTTPQLHVMNLMNPDSNVTAQDGIVTALSKQAWVEGVCGGFLPRFDITSSINALVAKDSAVCLLLKEAGIDLVFKKQTEHEALLSELNSLVACLYIVMNMSPYPDDVRYKEMMDVGNEFINVLTTGAPLKPGHEDGFRRFLDKRVWQIRFGNQLDDVIDHLTKPDSTLINSLLTAALEAEELDVPKDSFVGFERLQQLLHAVERDRKLNVFIERLRSFSHWLWGCAAVVVALTIVAWVVGFF